MGGECPGPTWINWGGGDNGKENGNYYNIGEGSRAATTRNPDLHKKVSEPCQRLCSTTIVHGFDRLASIFLTWTRRLFSKSYASSVHLPWYLGQEETRASAPFHANELRTVESSGHMTSAAKPFLATVPMCTSGLRQRGRAGNTKRINFSTQGPNEEWCLFNVDWLIFDDEEGCWLRKWIQGTSHASDTIS